MADCEDDSRRDQRVSVEGTDAQKRDAAFVEDASRGECRTAANFGMRSAERACELRRIEGASIFELNETRDCVDVGGGERRALRGLRECESRSRECDREDSFFLHAHEYSHIADGRAQYPSSPFRVLYPETGLERTGTGLNGNCGLFLLFSQQAE